MSSCNCLELALREGSDLVHPGDYPRFGSEVQLRIAEALARSFGHYLNGELTTYDIYLATLRQRGQHGLAAPTFNGDTVVHRTHEGLGSLGWRISPDGVVELSIYRPIQRPPVFEVRLDVPDDRHESNNRHESNDRHEPRITVMQHKSIESRHWMLANQVI